MARPTDTIEAGSFSRLNVYENCPKAGYYAYAARIPEPDRGEPHKKCPINPDTGEREWYDHRGTRIHGSMDKFVRGILDKYCVELKCLDIELTNVRAAYEEKMVYSEQDWAYDYEWQVTDWFGPEAWMRIKLDIFQAIKGTRDKPIEACAIDLKSGKIFGNEVKHNEQVQLYALGAFKRYPSLEKVHTELWYCDHNEVKTMTYRRNQALRFQKGWDSRMTRMLSDTIFKATPSKEACRWCPYRAKEDKGSGTCDVAFTFSQPDTPPPAAKGKKRAKTKRKAGGRSRAA